MVSEFFSLSYFKQQTVLLLFMLTLFLLAKSYFISDKQEQVITQKQIYQDIFSDVQRLEHRFAQLSNKSMPLASRLTEQDLAHLFIRHNLSLQMLTQPIMQEGISNHGKNLHIELTGDYRDFVGLLKSCMEEYGYLDIQHLSIDKTDDQKLRFRFMVFEL